MVLLSVGVTVHQDHCVRVSAARSPSLRLMKSELQPWMRMSQWATETVIPKANTRQCDTSHNLTNKQLNGSPREYCYWGQGALADHCSTKTSQVRAQQATGKTVELVQIAHPLKVRQHQMLETRRIHIQRLLALSEGERERERERQRERAGQNWASGLGTLTASCHCQHTNSASTHITKP